MATKIATVTDISQDGSVLLVKWSGLANGDDGAPVQFPEFGDRCVQAAGTFGAGGTVVWEGTNDTAISYGGLNNAQGSAVSLTAATAVKQVVEIPRYSRPRVSAGDGTTALDVYAILRRSNTMRT
jgi:hypothetical protein